jgi:hypothetical protein
MEGDISQCNSSNGNFMKMLKSCFASSGLQSGFIGEIHTDKNLVDVH